MKVLVANRGEIAVRVIRACRELDLSPVAVYSEPDEEQLHCRLADEAVCIGPAQAAASYLNADALVAAALETGAELVHPGYGFLAESASFAAACSDAGLVFVGPSPETIRAVGDKAAARETARAAGIPTVPGSHGVVAPAGVAAVAEEVGYPLLLKAAGGGGGRGIRTVETPADLDAACAAAAREAGAAFGDGSLYVEKLLVGARHVEVQVVGDRAGTVAHLHERECSVQRRRQKLVEEARAPALRHETRDAIAGAAVRLAESIGYVGAGTVEFLLDRDERFYFIEANARIQVEHPVTELVTGVDLVKEQLRVALGERLSFGGDVAIHGAAVEFRINAEDPARGFFPSPGTVTALHWPGGPGIRVDTALQAGTKVLPFYDSLVAKLVVWGRTRAEALSRARRALEEVHVEGIETTVPFHLRLLDDSRFVEGAYDTTLLEDLERAPA